MKRTFLRLSLMLWILVAACPAYCSTYYLDPNGNDTTGNGSIGNPWFTITKAVTAMAAGDTTYLRGGRYLYTSRVSISKAGSSTSKFYLFAYPGDARPILDFSALAYDSTNRGITLSGSYWYMKGFDIYKAGDNGMIIQGTYNIVEFCSFYENYDGGLQLANGAAYNKVINCDSYYNYDPPDGGDADGFSPKLTVGTGNYFYGCRSWQNSDDGYDLYLNAPTDNVTTTFENCWAFKNGYLKDGSIITTGNGNGFKMGSSTNHHNVILKNCLSFNNQKEGFDQNHNKGSMTLYNCTAYYNGNGSTTNNFEIGDALSSGYTAEVNNCVSFLGAVKLTYATQKTNSWQSPFFDVNSADFVSIDPCSAYGARKADGSLPDINFMHLAAGSKLINGGTYVGLPYHGTAPDLGYFEYGGCTRPFASDFNRDCEVDFFDYARLADAWANDLSYADLNHDGYLNHDGSLDYFDIAQFADEWLNCNRDPQSECWQP
jgi:hypothetical protein